MKTKTLVLAAVMFLGLGAAAFAQAQFDVASVPVTTVIQTGLTELTGDITFTVRSGSSLTGTITINYGVPITVDSSAINLGSGVNPVPPPPLVPVTNFTVNSLNNQAGVLVLNVPAGLTANQTLAVNGVRVAIANTNVTSLSATISSTVNGITAGENIVPVINSVGPGIASVTATTGTLSATTGQPTKQPTIKIKEGFLGAWQPQGTFLGANGTGIRLTVTGLPPGAVTVTFPLTATTDAGSTFTQVTCSNFTVAADSTTQIVISNTSSSPTQVCYKETAAGGSANITQETLSISPTVAGTTSGLPLASTSLSVTATMAPIGTAFDSKGNVLTGTAGYIPRFVAAEVGPATLLTVTGGKTTLLMPFAQSIPSAGYDTGIAIANTTADPGSTVTGITSPSAQVGTITFYFFPQASGGTVPASFNYTTSASSPGSGLVNGQVPSGSTYVVLLSQLLAAAQQPTTFSGYIFAVPNFTNAHGLYVISNFTTFSQGSLMLVISSDRSLGAVSSPTSVVSESASF